MAVSVISLLWIESVVGTAVALFGLGLGWNFSFVAATAELADSTQPWERGRLLGFNDLLAGMTGAGSALLGGLALDLIGVAALAIGAAVLVTFPAAWILRAAARRRGGPDLSRRPATVRTMSDLVPGSGGRLSRSQREQRAYRLVLASGGAAAVAVVGLVLAIVGVVGFWLAGARDRDRRGLWLVAPPHGGLLAATTRRCASRWPRESTRAATGSAEFTA